MANSPLLQSKLGVSVPDDSHRTTGWLFTLFNFETQHDMILKRCLRMCSDPLGSFRRTFAKPSDFSALVQTGVVRLCGASVDGGFRIWNENYCDSRCHWIRNFFKEIVCRCDYWKKSFFKFVLLIWVLEFFKTSSIRNFCVNKW